MAGSTLLATIADRTGQARLPAPQAARWWIRRRWLCGVLAVAVLLRAAVMVAYYPALEFHGDSYSYLADASQLRPGLWHPLGYPVFLRALSVTHLFVLVPLVQHLLGLASGLLIYRLLERHGVGDLAAALASAPAFLDAYQLDVEHMIMSEALFGFLLITGVYLLLDSGRSTRRPLAGGCLIGLATLTRTFALPCLVVLGAVLMLRRIGRRRLAAIGLTVGLPLGGYATVYHHEYGRFALDSYNGRGLYGGVAVFAQCAGLRSPTDRLLCPPVPRRQRGATIDYTWSANSPLQLLANQPHGQPAPADAASARRVAAANSIADDAAAGHFSREVIRRQPWDYTRAAAGIMGHFFAPYRHFGVRDYPDVAWQFPARVNPPPPWNHEVAHAGFDSKPAQPHLSHPVAAALRGYQRVMFTPGWVLLLGLLVGSWAAVRRRRDPRALVTAALLGCGVMVLVMPAGGLQYDHRYVLPAQMFLPAAGVQGWQQLREQRARDRLSPAQRRTVGATVVLLGLGVNAATGGLIPADRQRPDAVAPIGTTQHLAHAALSVTIAAPTFVRAGCVDHPGGHRLVWRANFPVRIRATDAERRLTQVSNVNVVGDHQAPFIRPNPIRTPAGMPDRVLTRTGEENSGLVQFTLPARTGVVVYNDAAGGGVLAWRYTVLGPAGVPLPGADCTPAAAG
jgi:hypothetical protein